MFFSIPLLSIYYTWLMLGFLWPPHAKSWLIGKDFDAGRDWGQEEMGMTEEEMAGWHHWLDRRESEWTSGSWWWTGRPGVLRFMVSQRVGHNWATDLIWSDSNEFHQFETEGWQWYAIAKRKQNLSSEYQTWVLVLLFDVTLMTESLKWYSAFGSSKNGK